jgi:radical SAM superfamily enzyme YgiQ (UPF0313 family)
LKQCKVLLVSGNRETSPYPVYPLALARLAAALQERGHLVVQCDILIATTEELTSRLRNEKPDLIGISIRNIDNTDSGSTRAYIDDYAELISGIRKVSQAPIILGGGGFSLFPHEILLRVDADYGVVGPGEDLLCRLADSLAAGNNPVGITGLLCNSRESSTEVQEDLQPEVRAIKPGRALHDSTIADYYWQHSGMLGVQTKRGCPKRCIYCTYPALEGRAVQHFDIDLIIEELLRIKTDFNVNYVFFTDAVFNTGSQQERQHELQLARAIEERVPGISWGAFFSPAGIDQHYLTALKKSGLRHVELGSDSLCDSVLDAYGKGFHFSDVLQASKAANALGLHLAQYIIFGGPGETRQTVLESLEKTEQLGRAVYFPCFGMRIYPGTPLWELARLDGHQVDVDRGFAPIFYFAPDLDVDWLRQTVEQHAAGKRNWLLPANYASCVPAMEKLRQRGMKGPLWEYLAGR